MYNYSIKKMTDKWHNDQQTFNKPPFNPNTNTKSEHNTTPLSKPPTMPLRVIPRLQTMTDSSPVSPFVTFDTPILFLLQVDPIPLRADDSQVKKGLLLLHAKADKLVHASKELLHKGKPMGDVTT
jgi:hypothetical protein